MAATKDTPRPNLLNSSSMDNDQEFLELRLRLLAQAAVRVPIVLLAICVIVSWVLKSHVASDRLILWIVLFQSAAIPRGFFAYWILKWRKSEGKAQRDYFIFIFLAALTGAAAGSSALLFFGSLLPHQQAFLAVILTGLVAGGVATSGSSPLVLAAYALAALLPLGFAWSKYGNDQSHSIIWLTIIFSLIMISYAREGKRVLYESFLIRRQRDLAYALLKEKNEEIQDANLKVEEAAQIKTRVLAAASHDLRQPLHALSIYSAVLEAHPPPETLKEIGQNIDQLVRSLGALLDAMLDVSRLDSQSFPVQECPCNLAEIAQRVSHEFRHALQEKGLQLICDFQASHVNSDPLIIERIFRNLLDNAVKYTDHGQLHMSTCVTDHQAQFLLSDTGKGIARDQIERVFEEFYQVNNPGRDRAQGIGLGLSIVKRMLKLLGAEMQFESTLGEGTRISVRMNASQPDHESLQKPAINTQSLQGQTVLLIDDEQAIIDSMRALLKNWGCIVLCAHNRSSAELWVQEAALDLVIADLRLENGENGVDIIRDLQLQFPQLPAIVITGETSSTRLADANSLDITVLQKPVSAHHLQTVIHQKLHL